MDTITEQEKMLQMGSFITVLEKSKFLKQQHLFTRLSEQPWEIDHERECHHTFKMRKNYFYIILRAVFVMKIFKCLH